MTPRGAPRAVVLAAALAAPAPAAASGFTDWGQDLRAPPDSVVVLDGYFRTRADALYNLDLDRGPTPSGQLLYPVPLDDPRGQTLTRADMRLRTDLSLYAPEGGLAVKVRADALDDVALGSAPRGVPSASASQEPPQQSLRVKRAYGEALTPFGLLAVGRMGNQWGLGILANAGDCSDCDSGDATDRIAFITPVAGHLWALAYDFTATGPFVPDRAGDRAIDIEPSANVSTVTFAVLRYASSASRARRRRAGKSTWEHGGYFSHRWQRNDVPATFLPTAQPVPIDAEQVVVRDYRATAIDLWFRLSGPHYRVEAEGALLTARVGQPSLIPGVLVADEARSKQLGGAIESDVGDPDDPASGGVDLGYASGDAAPGFGAFPEVGAPAPQAGDLDGPQARPPIDDEVNNFRFHPDYRIDRILFREIIGTVTDAFYLRPHFAVTLFENPRGALAFGVAAVASWAVDEQSPPGERRALGLEIDPTLRYASSDGFEAALEQATFLPSAGLDNPRLHLGASHAQLWRLRFTYGF